MPQLGVLETKVMAVLWAASDPLSVREVHESVDGSELAYTTIMTVLDRLAKKEILLRERDGKAWLYRPAGSREELLADDLAEALHEEGLDVGLFAAALAERLEREERALIASGLGED